MKRNEVVTNAQLLLNEALAQLISKDTQYALLDFPDHANVGDSAIWLGEVKILNDLVGKLPSYVCTFNNFNKEQFIKSLPVGPILIHGGGNFGDIWRHHQDFREYILSNFPDRLIIQLPQSIKFNNSSDIKQCAKIIEAHPNFHLMVRDQQSFEFSQNNFKCPVQLLPDSAFGLGPIKRYSTAIHDVFMLMRTDTERANFDRKPFEEINASSNDWLMEPSNFYQISNFKAGVKAFISGAWTQQKRRVLLYQELATGRLNRGLNMLSSGKQIITDRLHAHILCTLMNIPHVALDNNYGKISGYIKAWTHEYAGVKTAGTAKEALEKLSQLPKF